MKLSSSSITIKEAEYNDIGKYRCFAKNEFEECSRRHTLYPLNYVSKNVTNVAFKKGKDQTFNCNIEVNLLIYQYIR